MKRNKVTKGALSAVLAVSLALLGACSGGTKAGQSNSPSASPAASASPSASETASGSPSATPNPVTLNVQFAATGPDFEGTDVYNEIVKQTGVTFKIERFDEEKFKVQLAGGDLPDIIQVQNAYIKQLIEGGNIIPLDDLVQSNGPDIATDRYAKSLDYSRKFWSNDTGKLYMIPMQIGKEGWGFDVQTGFVTRWDYYKELGYPEINNIDDMVNVLAAMIEKHPKTADGKKVYGSAIWNDWGGWGLQSMGLMTGHGQFDFIDGQLHDPYTEPDHSGYWDTIYFLYKSQQKGILDPDAFTAKYDDIVAKGAQGTILSSIATWPFANPANPELLKQGPDKGYMTIPVPWGSIWQGGTTIAGWSGRMYAITKNCKDPERAMDLINFLVSEEGSRLIESGVQGVHWDIIDGKPQMKPEIIELRKAGGDAWKKTGINMAANQQGLTDATELSDGSMVNLFNTPEQFATQNNSLHNDYNQHYGVTYPAEAYKKLVDEGKVKNKDVMPQDIMNAMPPMPDDIKRIQAALDDMIIKGAPTIVLKSKDDADYAKRQQELINDLKEAGADQYTEWYKKAFEETKAKLEG